MVVQTTKSGRGLSRLLLKKREETTKVATTYLLMTLEILHSLQLILEISLRVSTMTKISQHWTKTSLVLSAPTLISSEQSILCLMSIDVHLPPVFVANKGTMSAFTVQSRKVQGQFSPQTHARPMHGFGSGPVLICM